MAPSYDPALELLVVGTSVTSPAPKFLLGGHEKRHLYHNSTLALEVDTGEVRWYYQHLNDHWDLDHPFERLLVDTAVAPDAEAVAWRNPRIEAGETRKVVTGVPGKTGLVYTLDRETGEFLWARPTVPQNVIERIDGETGAVVENAEVVFTELEQERLICPSLLGGKDWEAGAYSPLTNAMYYPLRNLCSQMTTRVGRGAMHYALVNDTQFAPGKDTLGTVYAISAETGETLWRHDRLPATMSLAATGGGLVFGGDTGGRFWALDQETGDVLWEINLGSSVTGFPDQLRGRRPPVRRRRHRRRRRLDDDLPAPDGGTSSELEQHPVRVRAALRTLPVHGVGRWADTTDAGCPCSERAVGRSYGRILSRGRRSQP